MTDEPITPPVDEPTEEPVVDEPVQDEVVQEDPMEKMQNDLQAWQGRKFKDFKDEMMEGMATLLNDRQVQPTPAPQIDNDPEPEIDGYDPESIKSWNRWEMRRNQRDALTQQSQADNAYFTTLESPQVRHEDESVHNAVKAELVAMGNNPNVDPYTNQPLSPAADAMLNYNKALRVVYEKQHVTPEPTNPLQTNGPPSGGLGVSQPGTQAPATNTSMPRLSPEAEKLVSRSGWNAEKVRKVLGNK